MKGVEMLDLNPKEGVSVQIRSDGKVVWVDVDGICRLRASNIPELRVFDDRPRRRRAPARSDEHA